MCSTGCVPGFDRYQREAIELAQFHKLGVCNPVNLSKTWPFYRRLGAAGQQVLPDFQANVPNGPANDWYRDLAEKLGEHEEAAAYQVQDGISEQYQAPYRSWSPITLFETTF